MARPRCFDCGRQLMYVKHDGQQKSVPVWVRYVDPAGHEHKLHVDCARRGDYGTDMVKQYGLTPNAELCGGPSGPSERAPGSAAVTTKRRSASADF